MADLSHADREPISPPPSAEKPAVDFVRTTPPRRLPRLTAARAFAAFAVFAYHAGLLFHLVLRPLTTLGYTGVSFFFILSGFVLTWSAPERIDTAGFYRRRFARIYPTYAAVLVVTGLLAFAQAPTHQFGSTLCAIFLVQAWLANPGIYAVNPPAWSLSVEASFYAAMPFLYRWIATVGRRVRWSVALGWFAAWATFAVLAARAGGAWAFVATADPLGRAAEFVLGIFAALELRSGRRLGPLAAVGTALGSVLLCWVVGGQPPVRTVELDPLFVIVIVVLAQSDIARRPGWLLTRRSLGYLGTISYEFYLVHQFVLDRVSALIANRWLAIAVGCFVAIAASIVLFELIQRPFERLLAAGRPAVLVRIGLVGASAIALIGFSIPKPQLPVKDATVSLVAAILMPGRPVVHLRGSEQVNFSAPAPSAVGSYLQTEDGITTRIQERVIGVSLFTQTSQMPAGSAPDAWSQHGISNAADFPGRPDDDPANLLSRLSAFGDVRLVGHPLDGKSTMTKYRVTVDCSRLNRAEQNGFDFDLDRHASAAQLTIWVLVDPNHLVRSVQYRDELLGPSGNHFATITANYVFSRFNDHLQSVSVPTNVSSSAADLGSILLPTLFT